MVSPQGTVVRCTSGRLNPPVELRYPTAGGEAPRSHWAPGAHRPVLILVGVGRLEAWRGKVRSVGCPVEHVVRALGRSREAMEALVDL